MDWAIGQMIESLHRTLQLDNTIVVFASDNGAIPDDPLHDTDQYPGRHEEMPRLGSNLPLRGQKATMYEGGVRTPAVISWPGTLKPSKMTHPIQVVDWMPTFTNLVGATTQNDPQWDGKDIWPLLTGETDSIDRTFYWNFRGGRNLGARIGDVKLFTDENLRPEKTEMFDLASDPYERRNIFEASTDQAQDLIDLIRKEQELDGVSERLDAPNRIGP